MQQGVAVGTTCSCASMTTSQCQSARCTFSTCFTTPTHQLITGWRRHSICTRTPTSTTPAAHPGSLVLGRPDAALWLLLLLDGDCLPAAAGACPCLLRCCGGPALGAGAMLGCFILQAQPCKQLVRGPELPIGRRTAPGRRCMAVLQLQTETCEPEVLVQGRCVPCCVYVLVIADAMIAGGIMHTSSACHALYAHQLCQSLRIARSASRGLTRQNAHRRHTSHSTHTCPFKTLYIHERAPVRPCCYCLQGLVACLLADARS